jgi:hypothetical protein
VLRMLLSPVSPGSALLSMTVTQPLGDVQEWSTLFAPDDDIHSALLTELEGAMQISGVEIHSSQFGFTDADIAQAFATLAKNPASRFLFDRSQAAGHAEAPIIADLKTKVPVGQIAVGTSDVAHQILHTKAVVLLYPDGSGWTLTGSYNLSASAAKQFNIVDIVRSRSRAELFAQRIDSMFDWVLANEPQS